MVHGNTHGAVQNSEYTVRVYVSVNTQSRGPLGLACATAKSSKWEGRQGAGNSSYLVGVCNSSTYGSNGVVFSNVDLKRELF
jgi:hypothetical protein